MTGLIPLKNLEALTEAVEKLNKRAKRLGVKPMELSVVGQETKREKNRDTGLEYDREYLVVELVGESPKIEGWKLVAKITPAIDVKGGTKTSEGLLVNVVPGEECPEEFRHVSLGRCDHCHTDRRRKDVFVLRHEDGEYAVIGRKCVADFLGHASAEALVQAAELDWYAEELLNPESEFWNEGGGGQAYGFDVEEFVGTTAIFVRAFGWTPRSATAYGDAQATADEVWNFLLPARHPEAVRVRREMVEKYDLRVTDADTELARKAIDWAKGIEDGGNYLLNLKAAVSAEAVTYKTVGITASVIAAYKRHVEREEIKRRERERQAALPESQWLGKVKERREFHGLTVLNTRSFDGTYGVTTLVSFIDDDGNRVKWFASGDVERDWPQGQKFDVVGTVKKHDEYKGVRETMINRVKELVTK